MEKERVLLVDDDPAFLELMTHLLRAEGRELITAADGEEGLAEARKKTPDLIILDIKMPRMDGFTVIRHLRSEAAFALVPVIFLTDLSEVNDRLKGFHLGADDFLSKRILPEELAARVTLEVRREISQETARLSLHDGSVSAVSIGENDSLGTTDAVAALLTWSRGDFEFTAGEVEFEDEVGESTTSLLMKAACVLDESGPGRSA